MGQVVLLLGSNLDNRVELLFNSRAMIIEEVGNIIKASSIYESEPWGYDSENSFLNQALHIETQLSPEATLEKCLSIETKLGRIRSIHGEYTDRSIDIDILLFSDLVVSTEKLEIPHPRMHKRRFCMEPLAEIASDWIIPTLQKSAAEVLVLCKDKSEISTLNA